MATDPATKFVESVRTHVETVLEEGRDRYGEERTPLLADAIDADALEAVPYDGRDVADGRRLSNFALQQEFLRTLVALARLTGDPGYREVAADLVSWVFENATDSTGLPYWGGHVAYDLDADDVATNKGGPHELKFEYPFYELLWEVEPAATRRFVEAFWDAHVFDWSILDFNRHGDLNEWLNDEYEYADAADETNDDTWGREYEGGDVFFWGSGLTFVNTGSDLYYAAGMLAALDGDDEPLTWAERLAERYVETRQGPGISGYQFSQHPSHCNGPEIRGDRAQYQFAPYIHGDHLVYEGTLFRPRPIVQRRQLDLGDRLGERGEAFTRWALEELRAWREVAYRPEENEFEPMLTDGYSLDGFVVRREGYYGPKGRIVGPIEAGPEFFWTYARAYGQTGDELCWRTARDVATGLGIGDIGPVDGSDPDLNGTTDVAAYEAIYGLLELSRATDDEAYLDAAVRIGRNVLEAVGDDEDGNGTNRFTFTDGRGRITLDDPVPLAVLHLAAAIRDVDRTALPTPIGDRRSPPGGI